MFVPYLNSFHFACAFIFQNCIKEHILKQYIGDSSVIALVLINYVAVFHKVTSCLWFFTYTFKKSLRLFSRVFYKPNLTRFTNSFTQNLFKRILLALGWISFISDNIKTFSKYVCPVRLDLTTSHSQNSKRVGFRWQLL